MSIRSGSVSFAILAMTLSALGGCAHAPQQARIKPRLDAGLLDTGLVDRRLVREEGAETASRASLRPLVVMVRDERARKIIGRRGDALGAQAAITAPPDLTEIVGTAMAAALRTQGFEVRTAAVAGAPLPVLRISLRDLSYESRNKILAGFTITASAALSVRTGGDAADFEQFYRSEKNRDAFPTPTAEANDALINAALDDVLRQALADPELKLALSSCRISCVN